MKNLLLEPFRLGSLELRNHMVMAPMTRSRALAGRVPNPLAVTYYTQRASAGLIVTEGAQVSEQGMGYVRTPGIHTPEQVAGWRKVTDSVHRAGGRIFLQLWHVGRASHPDFHGGELPVAPSAVSADGEVFTDQGKKKMVAPRALSLAEIPGVVDQFRQGALRAQEAGFDGVEIHGANGYLLDQFLRDATNRRTDEYGGAIENRARFGLEVARAVIGVWGAERVGYRISPTGAFNSMSDSNPLATFSYLARELSRLRVGYLHSFEGVRGMDGKPVQNPISHQLRSLFDGTFIVNGGYDRVTANQALAEGQGDLVAFGVPFLANPDLPERFRREAPLNAPDFGTFYTEGEKGFTDYPSLD